MKPFLVSSILSVLVVFLNCSTILKEKQYFQVGIMQNGKEEAIIDHKIAINKDAFSILIKFDEAKDVLVNASFEPGAYNDATQSVPVGDIKGFHQSWMAESNLNPDKELQISDAAPAHWFYNNEEEHRFNSIKTVKGIMICERIVENFYINKAGEIGSVKVKNAKKNTLYLVFISKGINSTTGLSTETHRDYLEITFK